MSARSDDDTLATQIAAELSMGKPIKRTRSDGKIRGNDTHLRYWAAVIVKLKADGTYTIIKDTGQNFEPRDETVYGIRDARALNLPKFTMMAGRMRGGVFMGKEIE